MATNLFFEKIFNRQTTIVLSLLILGLILTGWGLVPAQKEFPFDESLAVYHGKMALITFWGLLSVTVFWHIHILIHGLHQKLPLWDSKFFRISLTTKNTLTLSFYGAFLLLGTFLLLVWPGFTVLKIMTHDTFIFLDGAYRLSVGQIPHIDFHTPLGFLTYLFPYLGLTLSTSFAGAMPCGVFLASIPLTLAIIHVLGSRYSLSSSLLALPFLLLLALVPMNVGEPPTNLTYAMFYNRLCWVALTTLFLFFVEPYNKTKLLGWLDVTAISGILLFLLYTKITYFVAGILFLPILALGASYNRWMTIKALVVIVMGILSIEIFFGLTQPYFQDILMTIQSSGAIRKGLFKTLYVNNLLYLLGGLTTLLVFWVYNLRFSEWVYVGLVSGMGLAIINQNAQHYGIPCLLAIMMWAHEKSWRKSANPSEEVQWRTNFVPVKVIILILIGIFVSQSIINRVHGFSAYRVKKSQIEYSNIAALKGIRIGEKESLLMNVIREEDPYDLFFKLRELHHKQLLTQGEYIETVIDGVTLLANLDKNGKSLIVMDLANPFSFVMSMKPPKGDYSFIHAGRNISKQSHIVPEKLFRTVDYIMWPKFPMQKLTPELSKDIYGEYISAKYAITAQTKYWHLYSKVPVEE